MAELFDDGTARGIAECMEYASPSPPSKPAAPSRKRRLDRLGAMLAEPEQK